MKLRGTLFSCRVGPCSGRVGPCSGRVGPCTCRAGPCRCRVDSCLSGALPCRSGAVLGHPCECRVDSVSLPCSSVKLPCSSVFVREHTVFNSTGVAVARRLSMLESPKVSTDHPGSWSGAVRGSPGPPYSSVLIWDCSLSFCKVSIKIVILK